MNDLSLNYLQGKLETFIEQGWKEYPGGEPDEHRFYIEVPAASWTTLSHNTRKITDIERPHFLWKGEIVMRGSMWRVVKNGE